MTLYGMFWNLQQTICGEYNEKTFFFSWCGLKDGHLEKKHLISSLTLSAVKIICETDVLVIDEISMVSLKNTGAGMVIIKQNTCIYQCYNNYALVLGNVNEMVR